ncbi:MAG: UDP-N-acetylglucosamine 2-epimerase (non-hydrolyzing) [Anaerolineae bacterium]|nr:UDP-N-acetylglucosamine 2-epimerase (non-hydrolyzing) [Anaerolineae bacterium]
MLKVLAILGTRPEAVKMAPVIRQMMTVPEIDVKVCLTAQHREMLDQVLELFAIRADVDLNLMRPNQSLASLTADIFNGLDPVLEKLLPDWVLIQGDTTTVMVAALLAYYRQIRVGHVEAGLRTGNKWQPFPEETNRKVVGIVADLHFAPTVESRENLLREGVPDWRIVVTGNTVVDALQDVVSRPETEEFGAWIEQLGITAHSRLVLVTAHRRENFGRPLENICTALRLLAEKYGDRIVIVYPVHLNPNVQEPVYRLLSGIGNIRLIPPQDYLRMVGLLKRAYIILTDSGGIQEEATALRKPTLVLRNVTERPEGVSAGILKLTGCNVENILEEASRLLDDVDAYQKMANAKNPFGDGHAAERIVQALLAFEDLSSKGV